MGRKRAIGLEWLDPQDTDQRSWAVEFLLKNGFEEIFYYQQKIRPGELPSHQQMLHAGATIELDTANARNIFKDMKDAWRQQRSRNNKKQKGQLNCTFTINGDSKKNLHIMAKDLNISATALIEKLIVRAYQSHLKKREKVARTKSEKPLLGNHCDTPENSRTTFSKRPHQLASQAEPTCAPAENRNHENNSGRKNEIASEITPTAHDLSNEEINTHNANQGTYATRKKTSYIVPATIQENIAASYLEDFGPLETTSSQDE